MPSVTYKHQPGIHKSGGVVPLAGTEHLYTVDKILWPNAVESYLQEQLVGSSLHLCCGASKLGDVRLDADPKHSPDIVGDASKTGLKDQSFDTVLCDPPYNGIFRWNHDMLSELSRLARKRIIFQHWFVPVDKIGRYRKNHKFNLVNLTCWMPKSYFGRVQMISIFDRVEA